MYNAIEHLLSFGYSQAIIRNRHWEERALGAHGLRMPLPVNSNTRHHGERTLGAQGIRMPFSINDKD